MKVLVLNAGSSSHKMSLYELGETLPDNPPGRLWEAKMEWQGDIADVEVKNSSGAVQRTRNKVSSHIAAVENLVATLWNGESRVVHSPADINVVGHRIVH